MAFFTKKTMRTDRYGNMTETSTPRVGRIILLIAILLAVIITAANCCVTVPAGHTGVVTVFGRVENYTLDSGFHVIAPWQKVIKMDNRIQKDTVELGCFSSDIQEVSMTYTINYEISKANAMRIYSTIGRDYYSKVIVPCVTESVKVVTAKYTAEALIGNRAELALAIETDLIDKLAAYDVILVSTSIENMDFTDAFTNAVEEKQVAQQMKLKAETEAEQARVEAQAAADVKVIAAQAEADALKIRSEAEAAANKVIAESLTDEILNKMYYDTWDGKLPTVMGSDNAIIAMPTETIAPAAPAAPVE